MDNFLGISLYFVNPSLEWVPLFTGMREGLYPVQIELVIFLSGTRKTLHHSLRKAISFNLRLIDLCLTNSPDKISKSGVINIGISDHSAVYLTRKVAHLRSNMHKTVEVRQLKNFNEAEFLRDLRIIDWNRVTTHNNPNEMWDFWKHLLASVIDKHALFRTKRV